MQDDEQEGPDPDEEMVLPEEDELDRRRKQKHKVDLPERSGGSPLLRRVIVGEAKEKAGGGERGDRRAGGGRRRPGREIVGSVQPVGTSEEGKHAMTPPGKTRGEAGDRSDGDNKGLGEVVARLEPEAAPGVERRRRRTVKFDQEAQWEGREWSSLWWLGAGFLCLLMVGVSVFLVVGRGGGETRARTSGGGLKPGRAAPDVIDIPYEDLPIADFVARSAELLPKVRSVLMRSESGEGGSELLRGGEASLRRRNAWRERCPQPAPFREEGLHEIHASGNNRFAYLVLTGEREDFSFVEAYFVKDEDRMLFDWEATEGYSEVLPAEVEVLEDGTPRMMRAVIGLSSFYTDVYPEETYRCYTLHHDDPGEWLWAYADRSSEVDVRLLTHMASRDPLGRSRRVTVRIAKRVGGSRANQVEIQEMLFGGWIAPPAGNGETEGVSPDS